jgi:bidirectional [NiFe] hydrogenase diaphorase subunit
MVIDDLNQIAEQERAGRKKFTIRCCMAAGCVSSNSGAVKQGLEKAVKDAGLENDVEVRGVGCMKLCCQGPLVQVDAQEKTCVVVDAKGQGPLYLKVTPEDTASLVGTLKGGKTQVQSGDPQSPFFTEQLSIVLANSGMVNPERIESYIAAEGYQALHDVLREMTPKEVVDAVVKSGLRGRGGAGYPTGLKWATVAKTENLQKYVICNADEGDPGAFMDRSVLESDPHSILEGMTIAAHAVGASQGFIYVRAEYPLAISRLQTAIKQAKQHGLLGSGIFESPFNFNIELRIGAGAFVCGEETALMMSVEGKRGSPRPRPPFPAESGLWGCPTLINNVETFANIPAILRKGADWFAASPSAIPGGERTVGLSDAHQQRRDVRQHSRHPAQRRGLVCRDWHREEQGHEGFRAGGQNHEHRPHRSADGHDAPADCGENGRRRARRRQNQGRTNRRTFGRMHPRRIARHAGGLRFAGQARFDHGFGRHDCHGRNHEHGGCGPVLHGVLRG